MSEQHHDPRLINGKHILVIDDHRNIRLTLRLTLEEEGAIIDEADGFQAAKKRLGSFNADEFPYDVVLLDIRMPDGSGLDLLETFANHKLCNRVIMISGEGTVNEAFRATQLGAFDYIEKPFTPERIIVSVSRCVDFNRIQSDIAQLRQELHPSHEIIGQSAAVRDLLGIVERVAPTNGRVLIVGESGTGKELVAREIHKRSQRRDRALIKVNCAAIPTNLIESELFGHEKGAFTGAIKARKGVFERADGGTLFLDEIGELELGVQAKLLRVLQSGEVTRVGSEKTIHVDVRLIAATNRDLAAMVANNTFREDLYYRLNVVTIPVSPLRDRREDIAALATTFLKEACSEHNLGKRLFSAKAMATLTAYHWPGNVRELKNFVERLAILSEGEAIDVIDGLTGEPPQITHVAQLAQGVTTSDEAGAFMFQCPTVAWSDFHEEAGKAYVKYVLNRAHGNVSEAARILCLERAYLHRLMRKLGIQRDIIVHE